MKKLLQRTAAAFGILIASGFISSFFMLFLEILPRNTLVFWPFWFIIGLCATAPVFMVLGTFFNWLIDGILPQKLDGVYTQIVTFFKKDEQH